MKRRHLALATVGGLAGVAGAVWYRARDGSATPTGPAAASPGPVASGASGEALWWGQQVDRLDGSSLLLAELKGRRLIVNFWATWCPPCVREMPMIERFYQAHSVKALGERGWRILGVAIDRPDAVRRFLASHPVSYDIALAGLEGTQWSRELGNDKGGLPFTVVFGAGGRVLQRKAGELHDSDLAQWHAQG